MTDTEHRRHMRLKHRAQIRVIIPNESRRFLADMRDFSEDGLFLIYTENLELEEGSILEVQTTEFEDAPIQTTKIVRIEPGVGIGLKFIHPNSSSDIQ